MAGTRPQQPAARRGGWGAGGGHPPETHPLPRAGVSLWGPRLGKLLLEQVPVCRSLSSPVLGLAGARRRASGLTGRETVSCPAQWGRRTSHLSHLLPEHRAHYLLYDIRRACSGIAGIQTLLGAWAGEHVSDPMTLSYLCPQEPLDT